MFITPLLSPLLFIRFLQSQLLVFELKLNLVTISLTRLACFLIGVRFSPIWSGYWSESSPLPRPHSSHDSTPTNPIRSPVNIIPCMLREHHGWEFHGSGDPGTTSTCYEATKCDYQTCARATRNPSRDTGLLLVSRTKSSHHILSYRVIGIRTKPYVLKKISTRGNENDIIHTVSAEMPMVWSTYGLLTAFVSIIHWPPQ